ncbi:hypothetical protein BD289DRAFT_470375 [Coniella lustricola]|uniref:Uncharacterized protein n=1 Tax=Coniella lustricola TaxID=2025994 RepID=A0A2T3AN91_9PEZI|nr:hypothetical protein BD289DRAFT_470375 [Coniella lustricola]
MAGGVSRKRSARTKKQTKNPTIPQFEAKGPKRIRIISPKTKESTLAKASQPSTERTGATVQSNTVRRSSRRKVQKQNAAKEDGTDDDVNNLPHTNVANVQQTTAATANDNSAAVSSQTKLPAVGSSNGRNDTTKHPQAAPAPVMPNSRSESFTSSTKKQRQTFYKDKQERLRRFTEDKEVEMEWLELEKIIATYVREVLVDVLPIELDKERYPFLALEHLTDLALPMSQTKKYAPCLFELAVWNFLTRKFFSVGALNWAYETGEQKPGEASETQGLAAVMRNLTHIWGTSTLDTTKQYCKRLDFFEWRRNTVDFVFETLLSHQRCEEMANYVVFEILWTWMPFFKNRYMKGDAAAWDALILETSRIVNAAENLAVKMRRSADGVWSPFIPKCGSQFKLNEVDIYWDHTAKPMKPDKKRFNGLRDEKSKRLFEEAQNRAQHPQPDSKVTMTVVPGLHKYVVQRSPNNPELSVVEVEVRRPAMCFFDLCLEDVVNRHMEDEEDRILVEIGTDDEYR